MFENYRKDYISWDEYFMGIAILSSRKSKDPSTQVGACIVGSNKRILSAGYNGTPNGADDESFHWEKEGEWNLQIFGLAKAIRKSATSMVVDVSTRCRVAACFFCLFSADCCLTGFPVRQNI